MKTESFILGLMPNSFDNYGSPPSGWLLVAPTSQHSHPYTAPSHTKRGWYDKQNAAEVMACYKKPRFPSWAFSLSRITVLEGSQLPHLEDTQKSMKTPRWWGPEAC